IWTVPDDVKLHGKIFLTQLSISARQNIEIFFARNPTDIKQARFTIGPAKFVPEARIASFRIEKLGVETAWKNLQLRRVEPTIDPALPIFFRIDEHGIELAIEPMHITPGHALEKAVLGQNANVLRKIRVVDTARLQVEHFRREQCREPD